MKIPVSVIVVTKNEESRIRRCLNALKDFDEVIVVDSGSTDKTPDIARECGAQLIDFKWNGVYPKKRQWCLENVRLKHDRVFFVDADEEITSALTEEIGALDFACAGYFIRGRYVFESRRLNFGLQNNKLALMDRRKIEFPVVDDLHIEGMGEIEGHYQPVLKKSFEGECIGQLKNPLLHHAYEDRAGWNARHRRYARWENGMNENQAWPLETRGYRRILKIVFRAVPLRPLAAFIHSYILRLGFMDGAAGLRFAASRYAYYRMISGANTRLEVRP